MKSQVIYTQNLPPLNLFSVETVLFYDSILARNPTFKKWCNRFPYKMALKSGESLKTLESFTAVLSKVSRMKVPKSTNLTFIAVGGGSVGDFVGFLSSVFLRGRRLVMIPSTWLAAVDSAHGGKNGLNFLRSKNQIGSFYAPEKVFICQQLLLTQPATRFIESQGEILKAAILGDKALFNKLESMPERNEIYKLLPKIIAVKYRFVKADVFEKNGMRRLLNLGHTMGHILESHYAWPHGIAVLLGIQFSARWSFEQGYLNEKDFFRISLYIDSLELDETLDYALAHIRKNQILNHLTKDKKLTSAQMLDFIFIKKIGACKRQSVSIEQILAEVTRQKKVY